MSHHGKKTISDELVAILNTDLQLQAKAEHLNQAKKTFPDGKLTPDDEGAFEFLLNTAAGRVVINFGVPINWLAMTPRQARDLALQLRTFAAKARREKEE